MKNEIDKELARCWGGPVGERGEVIAGEELEVSFVDRIADPSVRHNLAYFISTNIFYDSINRGESFDEALRGAMGVASFNLGFLNQIAETRELPEGTWPEITWQETLNAMFADERPGYEPGNIRKWLAAQALRTEIHTGRAIYQLPPFKKKVSMSSEGIV